MEDNISYVTYGENEKETVINGIAAIRGGLWAVPPFEIFERNMDKVFAQLEPYMLYAINMGKEE